MNEQTAIATRADSCPLSPIEVLSQVKLIQDIMSNAMREGEHFGVIPGCGKKPSLWKAGAEKLCLAFRFAPSFDIEIVPMRGDHREYRVKTTLKSIVSGNFLGEGVGSCSTMESKYRYRKGEGEDTGKPVPKEYWKDRDIALIGGKGFGTRKVDGQWHIIKESEAKVENADVADQFNTVLKMAKKRSLVDAVLTATAASDIFTQDIEEIAENIRAQHHEAAPDAPHSSQDAPQTTGKAEEDKTVRERFSPPPGDDIPMGDEPPPTTSDPEAPPEDCKSWRDVKIHFGKNTGVKLGYLGSKSLAWYIKDEPDQEVKMDRGWVGQKKLEMKQGKKLADADLFLLGALLAGKKDLASKEGVQ